MEQLETRRLILRSVRQSDIDDIFEYAKDPRVGPAAGWPPHKTKADTDDVIQNVYPQETCTFALELKENGKMIGTVGFVGRECPRLGTPADELGYVLSPAYWGRGLMPEAVAAMLRYGFEGMGLVAIWCGHFEGNNNSRRVVEKSGFIYRFTEKVFVPLMNEERTELHYALTREEWAARA